ncbi:hypothetical protein ACCB38_14000, partial [Staphylococcus aureus]
NLNDKGLTVSRRKIGSIMKKHNLVSVYTKAKYKNHPKETNKKRIFSIKLISFFLISVDTIEIDTDFKKSSDIY